MRRIVSLSILVFLLFGKALYNQTFWERTSGPEVGVAYDIEENAKGHIFAATSGGVYRTQNAGESWHFVSGSLGIVIMGDIAVSPNGHIVALTAGGLAYASRDDGDTWQQAGLTDMSLTSVAAGPDGELYVSGRINTANAFGVAESTDGGESWQILPASTSKTISDLERMPDGNLIIGTEGGLYRLTAESPAFEKIEASGETWISDVVLTQQNVLFARTQSSLYRSRDQGKTWDTLAAIPGATLKLEAGQGSDLFSLALDRRVFQSTDDGASWQALPRKVAPNGFPHALLQSGGELFVGTSIGVAASADMDTWSDRNTGLTCQLPLGISVDGEDNVYAFGQHSGVFRSRDRGDTWQPVFETLRNEQPSSLLDLSGGILVCATNSGVHRSEDGGDSWYEAEGIAPGLINFVQKGPEGKLYAGSWDSGLFQSTDEGLTWYTISESLDEKRIYALVHTDAGRMFAATLHGVHYSDNDGQSWQAAGESDGLRNAIRAIVRTPGGTLIASRTSSGMYISEDKGVSWTQTIASVPSRTVHDLVVSESGIVYAGSYQGVLRSLDEGRTWELIEQGVLGQLQHMTFDSRGTLYTAPIGNAVHRANGNTTSLGPDNRTEQPLRVGFLQPNPASQTVSLHVNLPRALVLRLSLISPSGELVLSNRHAVPGPGRHSLSFSVANLAAGVYYCRLDSGGESRVFPLLVQR